MRGPLGWQSLLPFLLVLLCGCEPSAPPDGSQAVTGKLLMNGQSLQVANQEIGVGRVDVIFYPLDAAGAMGTVNYQAGVTPDGSFRVPGPSNRGLPKGSYRVVVRQWDPYPSLDRLNGKFDETNSKIKYEISGPTELEIELSKAPQ